MRRYVALVTDHDLIDFGALRNWSHKCLLIVILRWQLLLLLEVLRIGQYLAARGNPVCVRADRILQLNALIKTTGGVMNFSGQS